MKSNSVETSDKKKKGSTNNPKIPEHTKLQEWDNPALTWKMCEMIDYNSKIFTFLEISA